MLKIKNFFKKNFTSDLMYVRFCVLIQIIALSISFVYTYKFFATGEGGFELVLYVSISVIFEGLKCILNLNKRKTKKIKFFLGMMILVSITFTINSFINQISFDKENSKIVNILWTERQEKIEEIKKEIDVINSNIETEIENKVEVVNDVGSWLPTKKLEILDSYKITIDEFKDEKKAKDKELKKVQKKEIEKYVYGKYEGNINTKLLNWLKLSETNKQLIICILISILIDLTPVISNYARNLIKEKIIEDSKKIEAKNKKDEIKKIIDNSGDISNSEKVKKIYQINNKRSEEKKELINKIMLYTTENNNEFPGYKEIVMLCDSSIGKVQRAMKDIQHLFVKEGRILKLKTNVEADVENLIEMDVEKNEKNENRI